MRTATTKSRKNLHQNGATNGTPGKPEPRLERTQFTTSRLLEFFTEKELTMQIGHPRNLWPLALLKELVDNALDACENAQTAPVIRVVVEPDAVSVEDNGPGLPPSMLEQSLDYSVRISDKAHYVSPTRGQLGNASKCVWAAPFVADGEHGQVEVITGGERHVIDVTLDRIAQVPRLQHERVPSNGLVKTGTLVRLCWPEIASLLEGPEGHDFYNSDRFLRAYGTFNPHADFELEAEDGPRFVTSTVTDWQKWLPSRPTSPHWYNVERLRTLIAAYIGEERRGAKPKTVREFVSEFHGLTGTVKQKSVVAIAGLSNAYLHDLVDGDNVSVDAVQRLLNAMQSAARPVKPKALGVLGEQHLTLSLLHDWRCAKESIHYKSVAGEADGLPFVLEVAFGVHDKDDEGDREIITGVNWSPTLECPFNALSNYLLGGMRLDEADPVTLIAHLAYPRPNFTDRGKGKISLPPVMAEALDRCVRSVSKHWKKAKRQADHNDRLNEQQMERMRKATRSKEFSIIRAAKQVMEEAYLHASGNKADPANARQIMYAARSRVMELTGSKCWSHSSYFTQKLLPDFIEANPQLTKDWNVIYDARGHLAEPHTERRIDLGTLEVRNYINDWTTECPDRPSTISIDTSCPTCGPANRYGWALFLEKEGFTQLLQRHRILDRHGVAYMSTKGMSVTACRQLVDRLSEQGVTILVLRDFDKSGFSIAHTLRTNSHRYKFRSKPNVIDIGLRLADAREWGLVSLAEPVEYRNAHKDPRQQLRAAGATEEECSFLVNDRAPGRPWSGRRIELNAFTSPQFIEFLEHQFKKFGVKKVVPDAESLEHAWSRAWATAQIQEAIDDTMAKVTEEEPPAMPRGLSSKLAREINGSTKSWDEALSEFVREKRKAKRA